MLQDMQNTLEDEGKNEEELFEKFMRYRSRGESKFQATIDQGKA